MMARKRSLFILKTIFIFIFAAVIMIHVYRGSYFELPTQAQERMDWFVTSPQQEILLADLFPWPWERLCHTGDYGQKIDAERVLGRSLTWKESWTWYWYGVGAGGINEFIVGGENIDNLIFFDAAGDMKIYQDDNKKLYYDNSRKIHEDNKQKIHPDSDRKIYQDNKLTLQRFQRGHLSMNRSERRYDKSWKQTRCVSLEPYTYKAYTEGRPLRKAYTHKSCINNTKTAKLRKTQCGWQATDN